MELPQSLVMSTWGIKVYQTKLSTHIFLHPGQQGLQRWDIGRWSQQLLCYKLPVKSQRHWLFRRHLDTEERKHLTVCSVLVKKKKKVKQLSKLTSSHLEHCRCTILIIKTLQYTCTYCKIADEVSNLHLPTPPQGPQEPQAFPGPSN